MTPAPLRPTSLDSPENVAELWDALKVSTDRLGPHHFQTLAVAHTLAVALWHAGDVPGAAALLTQAVGCFTENFGSSHAATLAAQGDLAAILFELGRDAEADPLELEALEHARVHLGKAHAVTSVLAWNRALNHERGGDVDTARQIIANELIWLLAEHPSHLEEDQNIIRGMLADRFQWDNALWC